MTNLDCFETIRISDGIIHNLDYHNARLNKTRKKLYGKLATIEIKDYLQDIPKSGLFKAKIIYNQNIKEISCIPYQAKTIKYFKPITSDIEYTYKYTNRKPIETLSKDLNENTDIIIIKDNLVTDTSIANIAILVNNTWLTPTTPLLRGTTRARLLNTGFLTYSDITISDLRDADGFALMNAMIGFYKTDYKESQV